MWLVDQHAASRDADEKLYTRLGDSGCSGNRRHRRSDPGRLLRCPAGSRPFSPVKGHVIDIIDGDAAAQDAACARRWVCAVHLTEFNTTPGTTSLSTRDTRPAIRSRRRHHHEAHDDCAFCVVPYTVPQRMRARPTSSPTFATRSRAVRKEIQSSADRDHYQAPDDPACDLRNSWQRSTSAGFALFGLRGPRSAHTGNAAHQAVRDLPSLQSPAPAGSVRLERVLPAMALASRGHEESISTRRADSQEIPGVHFHGQIVGFPCGALRT